MLSATIRNARSRARVMVLFMRRRFIWDGRTRRPPQILSDSRNAPSAMAGTWREHARADSTYEGEPILVPHFAFTPALLRGRRPRRVRRVRDLGSEHLRT